jgi:hypothetical protein
MTAQTKGVDVVTAKLAGRCANGMERGQGVKLHAITSLQIRPDYNEAHGKALCGYEPGRRSVGWTLCTGEEVTCPRCMDKIKRAGSVCYCAPATRVQPAYQCARCELLTRYVAALARCGSQP